MGSFKSQHERDLIMFTMGLLVATGEAGNAAKLARHYGLPESYPEKLAAEFTANVLIALEHKRQRAAAAEADKNQADKAN